MTQEALSEIADVGPNYIGEIERGMKMPSLNTFIKMVNGLGISADEILYDETFAGKTVALNSLTKQIDRLTPQQVAAVNDILSAVLKNIRTVGE